MDLKRHQRLIRIFVAGIPALVLAACGGGEGQERIEATPQPVFTGILLDSPVAGVTYTTLSGNSGLTNEAGEFQYKQPRRGTFSETVTFSIGDIELGTVAPAPIITMVELTNSFAPTDRAAVNQLVFMQSLDSDGDPSNGITIDAATRAAAEGQLLAAQVGAEGRQADALDGTHFAPPSVRARRGVV